MNAKLESLDSFERIIDQVESAIRKAVGEDAP